MITVRVTNIYMVPIEIVLNESSEMLTIEAARALLEGLTSILETFPDPERDVDGSKSKVLATIMNEFDAVADRAITDFRKIMAEKLYRLERLSGRSIEALERIAYISAYFSQKSCYNAKLENERNKLARELKYESFKELEDV